MEELEGLCALAAGHARNRISGFNRVKGKVEAPTRLLPLDLASRSGSGVWIKLTDWQVDGMGLVDGGSKRRGRVTEDFRIAPLFDHVKLNEGGY